MNRTRAMLDNCCLVSRGRVAFVLGEIVLGVLVVVGQLKRREGGREGGREI